MSNQGASVVITHHIAKGKENDYKRWLEEIRQVCQNSTGFVDWQIIRPIQGLTFVYTTIIRFTTTSDLKSWMESPDRKRLIDKAASLFTKDDNYIIRSGLDFLFTSDTDQPKVPVRWKQYLVTWSAIYPLSLIIPLIVLPILRFFHFPPNRYLDSIFISGVIVLLMIYVIMPRYTKLIKSWLFK